MRRNLQRAKVTIDGSLDERRHRVAELEGAGRIASTDIPKAIGQPAVAATLPSAIAL